MIVEKTLKTLEFNKIIDRLIDMADSYLGKEKCRKVQPMIDIDQIQSAQEETEAAVSRILAKGNLSFSGLRDITASILRLELKGGLSSEELLNVAGVLEVADRVKKYAKEERLSREKAEDVLAESFGFLEPLESVTKDIRRCIVAVDEIADDASAELKSIRRKIKSTEDKVHSELNKLVNSKSLGSMLQDNIVTMRDGRYCVPVKSEYRSQVQGMIHDQSSSGSTVFIEPASVVNLNNEIRQLELAEKEEINRILMVLSNEVGEHAQEIKENQRILVYLDFVFAKAKLALSYNGSRPVFNENFVMELKKARHPLIDKKKVVPIDVHIGKDFRIMVITGPNTGGKTITLKTVGLLSLMGQSGLQIPAGDKSQLPVYDSIFADIGDEQSIEQSLSTFSAHMKNLVNIIALSKRTSLVLLDELCSGTDPLEGAALAKSILNHFLRKYVTVFATTHYSELKHFALSTKNVSNACCEFDVETLSPTYRLLIGIPGKSNAFAIATKLGLKDYIVEHARNELDNADRDFEEILAGIEKDRRTIEKDKQEIEEYKKRIKKHEEALVKKNEKMELKKEEILKKANEEAQSIVQDAKDFADDSIRKLNQMNKAGAGRDMENMRNSIRKKGSSYNVSSGIKAAKRSSKEITEKDLKPGTAVKVLSLNLNGYICSPVNAKKEVQVQMGILKSWIKMTDLDLVDEEDIKAPNIKKTSQGKLRMDKAATVSTSLNIIGMTTDEGVAALDKYLDDAYLSHLEMVTIIHGRGTGALKNAVHQKLRSTSYVKDYRLGVSGEGDNGVTIVTFK